MLSSPPPPVGAYVVPGVLTHRFQKDTFRFSRFDTNVCATGSVINTGAAVDVNNQRRHSRSFCLRAYQPRKTHRPITARMVPTSKARASPASKASAGGIRERNISQTMAAESESCLRCSMAMFSAVDSRVGKPERLRQSQVTAAGLPGALNQWQRAI